VVRGDAVTVRRHLDALAADEDAREVYVALARAAVTLSAELGTDPAALREIAGLLERRNEA
jgi:hypothetical protein